MYTFEIYKNSTEKITHAHTHANHGDKQNTLKTLEKPLNGQSSLAKNLSQRRKKKQHTKNVSQSLKIGSVI